MLDPTPPNNKRASLHLGRFHSLSQKRKETREQKTKPKNAKRFQAIPENRYSSAMTRSWEEEAAAAESDWDRMASSSLNWLSMSLNLVVATFAMRTNWRKSMIWLGFSTNSFLHGEESKKCGRFRSESYLWQFPESTATGSWGRGSSRSTSSPCFSFFLQPAREREREMQTGWESATIIPHNVESNVMAGQTVKEQHGWCGLLR